MLVEQTTTTSEAGVHKHALASSRSTDMGGAHAHTFMINGREYVTEAGGSHSHKVRESYWGTDVYGGCHKHKLIIDGVEYMTEDYEGYHSHELLSRSTTESGIHFHHVMLGDGSMACSTDPWEQRGYPLSKADGDEPNKNKVKKSLLLVPEDQAKVSSTRPGFWSDALRRRTVKTVNE